MRAWVPPVVLRLVPKEWVDRGEGGGKAGSAGDRSDTAPLVSLGRMAGDDNQEDEDDGEIGEGSLADDVASAPNDAADPQTIVDRKVPADVRRKYEIISYRNAAVILAETRPKEFEEILNALRAFTI